MLKFATCSVRDVLAEALDRYEHTFPLALKAASERHLQTLHDTDSSEAMVINAMAKLADDCDLAAHLSRRRAWKAGFRMTRWCRSNDHGAGRAVGAVLP